MSQNGAFYIAQLQIIHILNLQYNVLLTSSTSASLLCQTKQKNKINYYK